MMVLGAVWAHFLYAQAPGKFTHLIIQVTTVGRDASADNHAIRRQAVASVETIAIPHGAISVGRNCG